MDSGGRLSGWWRDTSAADPSLTLAAFRLKPAPLHNEMNNWCGTIHLLHGLVRGHSLIVSWLEYLLSSV